MNGSSITEGRRGAYAAGVLLTIAGTLAIFSMAASQASAQLPDICTQYPDLPQCQEPTGPTGPTGPTDDGGTTDDAGPTDVAGPSGNLGDGDGDLPFTGYPLTALILLLLILLLTGLAIRTYVAIRDRIAGAGDRTAGP